jgi:hypothetical protein
MLRVANRGGAVAVALVMTLGGGGLLAIPVAVARSGLPPALRTLYFGPMWLGANQVMTIHGRNVSDPASPMVEMTIFDENGVVVSSLSANVDPHNSINISHTGNGVAHYAWARIRTPSPLVRGSVEIYETSGLVTQLTGPTPALRGSPTLAAGGPVQISATETEAVALTNVSSTLRTVSLTFYDDVGTVLLNFSQNVAPLQTVAVAFPGVSLFEAYEASATGTGPSILATLVTTDANGLMSSYNPPEIVAS